MTILENMLGKDNYERIKKILPQQVKEKQNAKYEEIVKGKNMMDYLKEIYKDDLCQDYIKNKKLIVYKSRSLTSTFFGFKIIFRKEGIFYHGPLEEDKDGGQIDDKGYFEFSVIPFFGGGRGLHIVRYNLDMFIRENMSKFEENVERTIKKQFEKYAREKAK